MIWLYHIIIKLNAIIESNLSETFLIVAIFGQYFAYFWLLLATDGIYDRNNWLTISFSQLVLFLSYFWLSMRKIELHDYILQVFQFKYQKH